MSDAIPWAVATVVIALTLGITALTMFRRELAGVLERSKRVGTKWASIDTHPADQSLEKLGDASPPIPAVSVDQVSGIEAIEGVHDSAHLAERRGRLLKILDDKRLTGVEREKYLIRATAIIGAGFDHERVYRVLFGSQLRLLQLLAGTASLEATEARSYFDREAQDLEGLAAYGFERWFGFLVENNLVEPSHDSVRLRITPKGRDLLKYLIDMGIPPNRAW